ncbi:MAG: hypothetical protein A2Y82_01000 [Candidatus Buchananbacteria bacterium RBG_13_36_9]|uniref:Uncharacterized protein n=1 Tax=Candidatus Buchananbacteria bacterium RBG_13_36_9 TaxID=1797530 RepID=A0A1G1XPC9_9BACT|nr:MAG: hypothetical protein A2Y82_01000 [Candidatus Buchananbacteria bacterium RBG_13_36_9]
MNRCQELETLWQSMPALKKLADDNWQTLLAHVKNCIVCLRNRREQKKMQEQRKFNLIKKLTEEKRNKKVAPINKNNILFRCPEHQSLITSFGKTEMSELTEEEWDKIFEHSDNCPLCQFSGKKIGIMLELALPSALEEGVRKDGFPLLGIPPNFIDLRDPELELKEYILRQRPLSHIMDNMDEKLRGELLGDVLALKKRKKA